MQAKKKKKMRHIPITNVEAESKEEIIYKKNRHVSRACTYKNSRICFSLLYFLFLVLFYFNTYITLRLSFRCTSRFHISKHCRTHWPKKISVLYLYTNYTLSRYNWFFILLQGKNPDVPTLFFHYIFIWQKKINK